MESKTYSKSRLYAFLLGAVAIVALALVSVLAYTGLSNANRTAEYVLDIAWQQQSELTQMQLSFEKARVKIRNMALNTDTDINAQMMQEIDNLLSEFEATLDIYLHNINMNFYIDTLDEQREIIGDIAQAMQSYRYISTKMMESFMVNDKEAFEAFISEEAVINNMMTERFTILRNMNQNVVYGYGNNTRDSINTSILTLIVCFVASVVFLLLLLALLLSSIKNIPEDTTDTRYLEETPRIKVNVGDRQDADLLLSEFAKQINELKAVAYDLSRSAKERR